MNPALYHQISNTIRLRPVTGADTGLYRDTAGWIFLLQFTLWFCFYFSIKAIIFVLLFHYRNVFELLYLQSGKRKLTAGHNRLNRFLYFTRAVRFPIRRES